MHLGIDIGGTNIVLGLIENGGIIRSESHLSFRQEADLDETIHYLFSLTDPFMQGNVSTIGVGVPSILDVRKGIVYDTANIPSWECFPIRQVLEERYHVPVYVDNDSNCFALGAWHDLHGETLVPGSVMAGITLGTGLGVGIIHNGILLHGNLAIAGEICDLPYRDSVLETYCSSQFFHRKGCGGKDCAEKARKGDPAARAVFEEFGENLADLLNILILTYSPHVVVFGGGLARGHQWFEAAMHARLEKTVSHPLALRQMKIIYNMNEDNALIGTSLLKDSRYDA